MIPRARRVGRWKDPKSPGLSKSILRDTVDGNERDSGSRRGDPGLNFN